MKRVSIGFYLLTICALLIYSFSQVDLNLTLSSNYWYQLFQERLTLLGYFKRDYSTLIYIIIVFLLILCNFYLIYQSKKGLITTSNIIKIALTTTFLLLIAYPAFSYDIFNYIFDARILVKHNQNPWQFTALDFPQDLWTRFMHWTHRTYPYGPTWLPFTLPFYLLGFGKFVPTLLSFKLIGALSYGVSILAIYKISRKIQPKLTAISLAIYAFNPVILIEVLVSSHLDAVMAAFALVGIWLLVENHRILSGVSMLMSVGIKYVTVSLLPLFWLYPKRLAFSSAVLVSFVITNAVILVIVSQRELLPWYFITSITLASLIPKQKLVWSLTQASTVATLVRYIPYLWIGDYTVAVVVMRFWLSLVFFVLTFVGSFALHSYMFRTQKT